VATSAFGRVVTRTSRSFPGGPDGGTTLIFSGVATWPNVERSYAGPLVSGKAIGELPALVAVKGWASSPQT